MRGPQVIATCALLCFVANLNVQVATGAIVGVFQDATQARMPSAQVTEKVNIQFRAEAFNLTNTPTFFLPAASNAALSIGSPNY